MSCELYDDLIDDYLDGARASNRTGAHDARLGAFEAHLAGCLRCQALVGDFSNIRSAAASLEDHVPPPRLWARIAASIDEEQRKSWWERSLSDVFSGWRPVAAAAAAAMLAVGGAWLAWRPAPEAPAPAVAQQDAGDVTVGEQYYVEAIAGLQKIANVQTSGLDPETRAVLQRNLAVIDEAISESRAALAIEPASTLAQDSLLDALDTKVALLQDTVALVTEIDGDADDNAGGAAQLPACSGCPERAGGREINQ